MLTYSVVVVREYEHYDNDEVVLETYSNEKAAKDHKKFVEENDLYLWGRRWDYVFIRETHIADEFVKGGHYD